MNDDIAQSAKMLSDFITPEIISILQKKLKHSIDKAYNDMDLFNLKEDEMIYLRTKVVKFSDIYENKDNDISTMILHSYFINNENLDWYQSSYVAERWIQAISAIDVPV